MRHGSLFSGIGGFDLASSWMKWDNVFNCDNDPFCRRVLRHYWPQTDSYENIKTFDAGRYVGRIDVISGGFPCQPFSLAGKRRGTTDSRYLWPEMLRVVTVIRPRWVVGENVLGLLNWDGGMVFRKVLLNLDAAGYDTWPYILPAAGVGAPHRRDRIFFIGCRKGSFESAFADPGRRKELLGWPATRPNPEAGDRSKDPANPDRDERPEGGMHETQPEAAERHISPRDARTVRNAWRYFPSQPPICGRGDGLPADLDRITFSSWRRESLKAYGNAVTPQIAYRIFRAIDEAEKVHAG